MQFGIHVPNFGEFGEARALAELATAAEASGWDGFFIWDHILGDPAWRQPMVDPWIGLATIATRTSRIRIGPLVTALPRRRPWKVARETASLDQLSGGRLVLGVGLGWPPEAEYEHFGEEASLSVRARQLDEGLAIVAGLWSGEPTSFQGEHYQMRETVFLPTPVQRPRIPVWVAVHGSGAGPVRRAARWDDAFPENPSGASVSPEDVRSLLGKVGDLRSGTGSYDVVVGGRSAELGSLELAELSAAGVTWWLESVPPGRSLAVTRDLIRRGPPAAPG